MKRDVFLVVVGMGIGSILLFIVSLHLRIANLEQATNTIARIISQAGQRQNLTSANQTTPAQ